MRSRGRVMLQLLLLISRSLSLQFQLVNLRSKRSRFECFWLYRAAVSSNRLSRSGLRRPYFQPASAFFRLRRPRRFVDEGAGATLPLVFQPKKTKTFQKLSRVQFSFYTVKCVSLHGHTCHGAPHFTVHTVFHRPHMSQRTHVSHP